MGAEIFGAIGQGLSAGVDTYLKALQLRQQREEREQARKMEQDSLNFQIASKGYEKNPETGKYGKTVEQQEREKLEGVGGLLGKLGDDAPYVPAFGKYAQGLLSGKMPETTPQEFQYPAGHKDKVTRAALANRYAMTDYKEDIDEQKYQRTAKVPGYQLGPESRPQLPEVSKFRTATVTAKNIGRMVDELLPLVNTYGIEKLPGETKAKMKSKMRELQLAMKEYANLGVLNGPDMMILADQIGDPTSGIWYPGRVGGILETLKEVKDSAGRGIDLTARSMGYSNEATPFPRSVRHPDGRQAQVSNEKELREANAEGFY